jgi:hypothetical protein
MELPVFQLFEEPEPEISLASSQYLATGAYPEPLESSPHLHTLFVCESCDLFWYEYFPNSDKFSFLFRLSSYIANKVILWS